MLQQWTGCVSAMGLLAVLSGCGAPIITTDDVVMSPGQAAKFAISIDRQYGKGKIAGAEVDFLVNGRKVAQATTDRRGMAVVRAQVPERADRYAVVARHKDQTVRGHGRIFQWDSDRTAVAIDIDETISATHYGSLFLTELDTRSPAIDYSPAAVRSMHAHYGIVYLSSRPRWLHEKTRVWLEAHGFPPGPILHASRFEACLKQEKYKRELLAEFKQEFPNLLIGIGDKGVDERAYGANRMLTVIYANGSRGFQEHCIVLPDWRRIEEFFIQHRATLCEAGRLKAVIYANNMRLRPFFEKPADSAATALVAADAPSQSPPTGKTRRNAAAGSERDDAKAERGDWTYGYQ